MKYCLGIDIGSTSTQLMVLEKDSAKVVYHAGSLTGSSINNTAYDLLQGAKEFLSSDISDFIKIVATGYGRKLINFDGISKSDITEITCYAKGAYKINNKIRTIIDIGGQDSKAITLADDGAVCDFVMNDKCAAGTGKFLEMVARQFDLSLDVLGSVSEKATKVVQISNICAVFAQSEIINKLSKGASMEDIIKSVEIAIVSRVLGMAERLGIKDVVMFCGGVAKNHGMIRQLDEALKREVFLPEYVDFVGAYGAALFAIDKAEQ